MKIFDLLLMSMSNLWKRKLRTVLTVLGVVIGITSIVVMVALGNGLKESMLENYQNYSSMTQIRVSSGGYYYASSSSDGQSEEKKLDDAFVNEMLATEHVEQVYPHLTFDVIAKAGRYMSWISLTGMTQEELLGLNLELAQGSYPDSQTELKFLYGHNVPINFYDEKTGSSP